MLTVFAGPMFSGKTTALIEQSRKLGVDHIWKPRKDTRDEATIVKSHDGLEVQASILKLTKQIDNSKTIFIDEAQFLSLHMAQRVVDISKKADVYISMLDRDFKLNYFKNFVYFRDVGKAKVIWKFASCAICGGIAPFSYRKSPSQDLVLCGASEAYEPRCKLHFGMKKCTQCGKSPPEAKFCYRKDAKDKMMSCCNKCKSERKRQWHKDNNEHVKKWRSERRVKFKEEEREWRKQYTRNKLDNDELFKFKHNVRSLIRGAFRKKGYRKGTKTESLLGDTYENVLEHLKSTAVKNYGRYDPDTKYHIDHIVPMVTANSVDEVANLQHYSNLQLLTEKDNGEKGSKLNWKSV